MTMRCSENPATRNLAKQLLAFEGVETTSATSNVHAVSRVCDKLRRPLATLAGAAGFRSLLERALAVAKQQCPTLDAWKVEPDGSLLGLDSEERQSGTVLIAQLIGLMITFIGESLTLRLLHDAWPNLSYSEFSSERCESK
jgi:CheY-like chemotaxis protein